MKAVRRGQSRSVLMLAMKHLGLVKSDTWGTREQTNKQTNKQPNKQTSTNKQTKPIKAVVA
jgi:hypothetical protein